MRALKLMFCCVAGLAIGKWIGDVIDPLGAIIVNVVAFLVMLWLNPDFNPDNACRSKNWHYECAIIVATATMWITFFVAHLDRFR